MHAGTKSDKMLNGAPTLNSSIAMIGCTFDGSMLQPVKSHGEPYLAYKPSPALMRETVSKSVARM